MATPDEAEAVSPDVRAPAVRGLIWQKIRQVSWRWGDDQRDREFAKYFKVEPSAATTEQLLEFLFVAAFNAGQLTQACTRRHVAVPRAGETFIDYSDLAADGPSTTAEEAWANVEAYFRQQERALSAYTVDPRVNVEIADEVVPGHVLRWSSLRVLRDEHKQTKAAEAVSSC